jgi:hypothetical protein
MFILPAPALLSVVSFAGGGLEFAFLCSKVTGRGPPGYDILSPECPGKNNIRKKKDEKQLIK